MIRSFFRPVIRSPDPPDNDIELARTRYDIDLPYESMYALTRDEVRRRLAEGRHSTLLQEVFERYRALQRRCDFVVCEGTDFTDVGSALEFDFNARLGIVAAAGDVGAPAQLDVIARTLLVAVVNHEYQHAQWIGEVRTRDLGRDLRAPERVTRGVGHHRGAPQVEGRDPVAVRVAHGDGVRPNRKQGNAVRESVIVDCRPDLPVRQVQPPQGGDYFVLGDGAKVYVIRILGRDTGEMSLLCVRKDHQSFRRGQGAG